MKKTIKSLTLSLILLISIAFAQTGLAQGADPPPPPSENGTNGDEGGGAPVDGGIAVVLALVAGYGSWKLFKVVQEKKNAVNH
jgi:hypothetical protein